MIDSLKPYPLMKDSGLPWAGQVPSHWELVPNRALLRKRKVLVGDRHSDYRLLSLTKTGVIVRDISTGRGKFSADMRTSQEVREGDLVFCLFDVPETPRTVGLSKHHGMITGAYTVFECKDKQLARFLETFYIAMDDRKLLSPLYTGLRNTIPPPVFLGQKTPLPPAPEQAAIIRFLDHADRKIRRYIRAKQKLIKLLEEQITARASDAMHHPACTTQRLGRVATEHVRSIARNDAETYVALGLYNRGRGIFHKWPMLGAELGDSTFSWVEPGDLVISGQFAWEGAVALASSAEKQTIVSHRYYTLTGIKDRTTAPYLWALLRSSFGAMLLEQHSRGAAGRNRPLNLRTLLKELVPIPAIEMQLAVDKELAATAPLRLQAAEAVDLLREYRTRLITDVVTGKLDVREAAAQLPDEDQELPPIDGSVEISDAEEDGFDDLDEGSEDPEP